MSVSDDLLIMAKTIHGEARGEIYDGALAVGWVIANRARLKIKGTTIRECCLSPWQFSTWNSNDPNLKVIAALSIDSDPGGFMRSYAVAAAVLGHTTQDPTGGATDYHTVARPAGVDTWPPTWARDYTPTVRIGAHQFYRRT